MKPNQPVGIYNYEIRSCSEEFVIKIGNMQPTPNPLPQRKSIVDLPFSRLQLGAAMWFDMDELRPDMIQGAMRALRYYNKRFDCFDWKKHRGDGRKSGFKFLEIARIK